MKVICRACAGNGYWTALVDGPRMRGLTHITCWDCKGSGEVDPAAALWEKIGDTHRTWRVASHEGLAACAERLGIDARDLNDMEHGRKDPMPLLADIPEILRESERLPPISNKAA